MAGSPNASNMVVGLDIGTSKVVAIVGQPTDDGGIEIAGIGSHPSRGMKRGVVINIESTVQSIQRAVEEAELMAGCDIHSVYVGVAGSHISSMNSDGVVAIKEREVTPSDIDRVIDSARARAISEGQRVLLVEDLATDGGSKINFVSALREAGAKVDHSFVIFYYDIFRDTPEKLGVNGIELHYLVTWWDVLAECKQTNKFNETTLSNVEDFLFEPRGWSQANGGI